MNKTSQKRFITSSQPTVIDLFSGAGVFASSFVRAGFKLVDAIEVSKEAMLTHHFNLGKVGRIGDITALEPVRNSDVIIAGPPCQGFSSLGRRDVRDPRNNLCSEVTRWTKIIQPKLVIVENVPQFLSSPQWKGMHSDFTDLGYHVTTETVNARDFGVPQLRERSFTFASRCRTPVLCRSSTLMTVRDAFKGLSSMPNGINNHYAPAPTALALERILLVPRGGDKRDILRKAPHLAPKSWLTTTTEATDVWGRMVWNGPSNTIRTKFLHPSNGRYLHPEENRVISLREAARLHSIPDEWQFVGTPCQIAKQIGNSVPYKMGLAIAKAAMDALF